MPYGATMSSAFRLLRQKMKFFGNEKPPVWRCAWVDAEGAYRFGPYHNSTLKPPKTTILFYTPSL